MLWEILASTALLRMFLNMRTVGLNQLLVEPCFVVQFSECCSG